MTSLAVPNPCWCCGDECMFCLPGDPACRAPGLHWCPACKYGACPDCCGCGECRQNGRAGWTPAGTPDGERVSHGGGPLRRWVPEIREALAEVKRGDVVRGIDAVKALRPGGTAN